MSKRYTLIVVFALIMAAVAVVGYLMPTTAESVPIRILFDNAGGKVVFNHQKHMEEYGVSCETCHHESSTPREDVQPCGTCHGVTFDDHFRKTHAAAIQDEASCVTCHHMDVQPSNWSHEAHATEYDLSCTDCHHSNPDIEPEPSRCTACHLKQDMGSIPSMKVAAHTKCATCHQDMFDAGASGCVRCHPMTKNKEVFAKEGKATVRQETANCLVCHTTQKIQDLIPNRMEAFHGQCIACHERNGKGPFGKEHCAQCHTK